MSGGAAPEFHRPLSLADIGHEQPPRHVEADAAERAALAERFGLLGLALLRADFDASRDGAVVTLSGTVHAQLAQRCVVTGEPVAATIAAPVHLRLVPPQAVASEDEIELAVGELDTVEHDGRAVDLGEIAAQEMALSLDPFPRAKGAADVLREAGVLSEDEVASGPFAALSALKRD